MRGSCADACAGNLTESDYFAVIERKTASLFAFACYGGALCGGGDPEATAALERFGTRFGTAFQIIDDLIDLGGDRSAVGKAVGQDLREGHITLPVLLAMKQRPEIDAAVRRLLRDLAAGVDLDGRADEVMAAVCATDAAAVCRARAAAYAATAVTALAVLPQSDYRAGLSELVAQSMSRQAESSGGGVPILPIVVGVAGLAAAGVGVAFGAMAKVFESCAQAVGGCVGSQNAIGAAKTQSLLANVMFGVGGAGVAGAVLLFLLSGGDGDEEEGTATSVIPMVAPGAIGIAFSGNF